MQLVKAKLKKFTGQSVLTALVNFQDHRRGWFNETKGEYDQDRFIEESTTYHTHTVFD